MQNANVLPTDAQIAALVEEQHVRFIKNSDYRMDIEQNEVGDASVTINGEEIPLLDMAFDLRLVQPGSIRNNKALSNLVGKILVILNSDQPEQEYTDCLYLMPITITNYGFRNFSQYDGNSGDGQQLICYSVNGVTPAERVVLPLHPVCAEIIKRNGNLTRKIVCPHAVWEDNKKPECRAVVTLAFFDLERKIPVRIQLHGTAYGAWNALQRSYKQVRNVARLKRKSINDYVIQLTVENNGTYCTPVFKIVEAQDNDKFGRPSDYLPVCKYYMTKLFSNVVSDDSAEIELATTQADNIDSDVDDNPLDQDTVPFSI